MTHLWVAKPIKETLNKVLPPHINELLDRPIEVDISFLQKLSLKTYDFSPLITYILLLVVLRKNYKTVAVVDILSELQLRKKTHGGWDPKKNFRKTLYEIVIIEA